MTFVACILAVCFLVTLCFAIRRDRQLIATGDLLESWRQSFVSVQTDRKRWRDRAELAEAELQARETSIAALEDAKADSQGVSPCPLWTPSLAP